METWRRFFVKYLNCVHYCIVKDFSVPFASSKSLSGRSFMLMVVGSSSIEKFVIWHVEIQRDDWLLLRLTLDHVPLHVSARYDEKFLLNRPSNCDLTSSRTSLTPEASVAAIRSPVVVQGPSTAWSMIHPARRGTCQISRWGLTSIRGTIEPVPDGWTNQAEQTKFPRRSPGQRANCVHGDLNDLGRRIY